MDRHVCGVALAACIVFTLCGCSSKGPATVPTTGTVLYNGKAVEGASVTFMIKDSANGATGVTDAQGKFTLSTMGKGGAVAGLHMVGITKIEATTATSEADEQKMRSDPTSLTKMMQNTKPPKSELPAKYASPQTSGLTATVDASKTNDFTFELKD